MFSATRRPISLLTLLLPLVQHIAQMERKPPVTLALVAGQVLLYLKPQSFQHLVPAISKCCLQPYRVLELLEWRRLLWAPFLHASDMHLFYNMMSLLWKGAMLEPAVGGPRFAQLVAELVLLSHSLMVAVAAVVAAVLPSMRHLYYTDCAVGFSAVLFALKVIINHNTPGDSAIWGVRLPTKYLCWAELVLIQLLVPNASVLGHLSGILAGLLHIAVRGSLHRRPLWWRAAWRERAFWPFKRRAPAFAGEPQFAMRSGGSPASGSGQQFEHPLSHSGDTRFPGRPYVAGHAGDNSLMGVGKAAGRLTNGFKAGHAAMVETVQQNWRWQPVALTVVFMLVAFVTNPDEAHFVAFATEYSQRGLGYLPGFAVGSMVWLQSKMGVGFERWNYWLFSVARYYTFWFVGAFGCWVPIPTDYISHYHNKAGNVMTSVLQGQLTEVPSPLEVIIALYLISFAAWLLLPARVMTSHFEVSLTNARKRPWTFLTAPFSHNSLFSVIGNMQLLLMVAPALQEELGPRLFSILYLTGGILPFLASYLRRRAQGRRLWHSRGAANALYALLACNAMVHPYRSFVWLFGIEVNSLGLLMAKLLYEFAGRLSGDGVDLWDHIFGAGVGAIFAATVLGAQLPKTVAAPVL